jgi:hypothetical protein
MLAQYIHSINHRGQALKILALTTLVFLHLNNKNVKPVQCCGLDKICCGTESQKSGTRARRVQNEVPAAIVRGMNGFPTLGMPPSAAWWSTIPEPESRTVLPRTSRARNTIDPTDSCNLDAPWPANLFVVCNKAHQYSLCAESDHETMIF